MLKTAPAQSMELREAHTELRENIDYHLLVAIFCFAQERDSVHKLPGGYKVPKGSTDQDKTRSLLNQAAYGGRDIHPGAVGPAPFATNRRSQTNHQYQYSIPAGAQLLLVWCMSTQIKTGEGWLLCNPVRGGRCLTEWGVCQMKGYGYRGRAEGKQQPQQNPFSVSHREETIRKVLEGTGSCCLRHTGLQLLMISVDVNIISSASRHV